MLRPTKHSHPDKTVVGVSLRMMVRLRMRRLEGYSELRQSLKSSVKDADALFVPALNLLYILGLIKYHPKTDSVEFLGPR